MKKLNLLLIFGGKSAEHEVSIESAKNIILRYDKKKYNLLPLWIDKEGNFFLIDRDISNLSYDKLCFSDKNLNVTLLKNRNNKCVIYDLKENNIITHIDIAFPVLHGPFGEDGTIQGYLETVNCPYIGSGVLSSSICMNKIVSKELLKAAKLKVANFLKFNSLEDSLEEICEKVPEKLKFPVFVKPSSLGSSIGISKVNKYEELINAIEIALKFDNTIIIEEAIKGREIEIAIIGNKEDELIISKPGEIKTNKTFYSYEAKYLDEKGTKLIVPAKIDEKIVDVIKKDALKAYRILYCKDYARIDMFLDEENQIFINEINTIPGFTTHSMFPLLMEEEGINYQQLIDRLINIALKKSRDLKI
ncbi:MAG: D-alanine--D-alanine ligase family protein [Deferribacterota bacterium]|nr:D-alanine--D-alanine ligase family protein [Deferribacterota bacterium]